MASQLPLPLPPRAALSRENFIAAPGNVRALAFIESWPNWAAATAALHGPPGSGKSHLVEIWRVKTGATVVPASAIADGFVSDSRPLAVENIDGLPDSLGRDRALFAILERATHVAPVLLTGNEPPASWPAALPDLKSRFSALLGFPLWAPDDALLAALARKLFADRQLRVPDAVIERMIVLLERSPAAIRDFVARADAKALGEGRAVTAGLVRELLAERPPS